MIYNDSDYHTINRALKRFLILFVLSIVLLIAVFVVSCSMRIAWLGYAVGALWAIGTVFTWGMIGTRIVKYRRYLMDIATGLEREANGVVKTVDRDVSIRQGLEFYSVELEPESDDIDDPGRRVYYDASKGKPPYKVGEEVKLLLFGNFIKGNVNETQ